MKKRIFTLLLCAACITACCSCGNKDTENIGNETQVPADGITESATAHPKAEAEPLARTDYFALLPDEDYGGREFIIAATDTRFADAQTAGGIVGAALEQRIAAIEQKYNISIKVIPTEADAVKGRLAVSGDENYFCDLLYIPMDTVSTCAEDGLLMNIYSLPFFDENAEYTQAEHTGISAQNSTAYGLYGNAAFDDRYAWCVYYNKYYMNGLGYDPAALAASGEWTWDKFLEIASAATADIDNNGRMNAKTDRFGYASADHTEGFAQAVFASFGKKYFTADDSGLFAMDFAVTEQDNYFSEIKNICAESDALYPDRTPGEDAFAAFAEGRLAFLCDKLTLAEKLAYLPMEWGVVPMPKRNIQQESYINLTDGSVCGYSVPATVADSILSGKVLNAIYAYDYSYGADTVQQAWTYYYLRDNTASVNVKNICNTNIYDSAHAWCADQTIYGASAGLIKTALERNVDFSKLYDSTNETFAEYIREKFTH